MTASASPATATALKRFGLGPRPGDAERINSDPRGSVLDQLARPQSARIDDPALPPSDQAIRRWRTLRDEARAQEAKAAAGADKKPTTNAMGGEAMEGRDRAGDNPARVALNQMFRDEVAARSSHAIATQDGFVERLVMFWSNHFCVSVRKAPPVRAAAGPYEREAIRPHVLGRFRDMLGAVMHHPAMLVYLDNAQSTGPNSPAGQRRSRGLNENLGRELMELHTVGVGGGYGQRDVTEAARVLTGWTMTPATAPDGGRFIFNRRRHEPGAFQVMGVRYDQDGIAKGETLLDDLASRPETAQHVAAKLVRHFVTEAAPPDLVAQVAKAFRDSDGDLAATARALAGADAAWAAQPVKTLPPYDLLIAAARATGWSPQAQDVIRVCRILGEPIWAPSGPNGYSDADDVWATPAALIERLDWAGRIARQTASQADMRELARDLFGDRLSAETADAVRRAESRQQALALLIMSPEFVLR